MLKIGQLSLKSGVSIDNPRMRHDMVNDILASN
jgi:hypothetical protein